MKRFARTHGGWLVLAALVVGCGGNAPETPPEQKTPESGREAMEKLKSMAPLSTGKAAKGQSAMEKMKSMGKTGK